MMMTNKFREYLQSWWLAFSHLTFWFRWKAGSSISGKRVNKNLFEFNDIIYWNNILNHNMNSNKFQCDNWYPTSCWLAACSKWSAAINGDRFEKLAADLKWRIFKLEADVLAARLWAGGGRPGGIEFLNIQIGGWWVGGNGLAGGWDWNFKYSNGLEPTNPGPGEGSHNAEDKFVSRWPGNASIVKLK